MRYVFKYLALCCAIVVLSLAQPRPGLAEGAVKMTPEIQGVLKKAEDYLENIKTMQAEFLQISSNGETGFQEGGFRA